MIAIETEHFCNFDEISGFRCGILVEDFGHLFSGVVQQTGRHLYLGENVRIPASLDGAPVPVLGVALTQALPEYALKWPVGSVLAHYSDVR